KIDHLAGANTISGTYIFQRDKRLEPTSIGLHNLPGFGDFRPARRQLLALRYLRSISPRTLNEFRAGMNRVRIDFLADEKRNPRDFGITSASDIFPDFRISGGPMFGGLNNFPQGRGDTTFQYTDTLALTRGSHSIKLGAEARRIWNNNIAAGIGGIIRFPSIAAFLSGQPNQTQVTQGATFPALRVTAWNFFLQDDFKVSPRFTLNLGVRYEYNGVPTETHNRLSVFDFNTRQLVRV